MELMKQFVNEYGTAILYTVITAIAGYLGVWAKKLYGKYISDKTKKAVAKTVVMAIEQLYRDLNGEEKLEKALEYASDMLEEKGISITELELRMLIEAAVGEFNDAFHRDDNKSDNVSTESSTNNEKELISDAFAEDDVCTGCLIFPDTEPVSQDDTSTEQHNAFADKNHSDYGECF